jgi:Domain of unknown function (DUF6867)
MMSLFIENSPWVFLILTVLIGGTAAWLTGRALAIGWRPTWQIIFYMSLLGLVLRFFHFALFQGTLVSLHYYVTDTLILLSAACLGYRLTRVKQMVTQYAWEVERTSLFSWRNKFDSHKS